MEDNTNNKKKKIRLLIIGLIVLLITIIGATYAYFSITGTNNSSSSVITNTFGESGNVTLTGSNTLHITLNATDMATNNKGNIYYATDVSGENYKTTSTSYEVAKAQVVGGDDSQSYSNCKFNLNVALSGDMANLLQEGDMKITFSGAYTGVYDLSNLSSPYEVTLSNLSGTNRTQSINAVVEFNNLDKDQVYLAGKTLTITLTNTDFSCNGTSTGPDYLMVQTHDQRNYDVYEYYSYASVFGKNFDGGFVEKILFMDHKNVPSNAIDSWDVSEKQNGSVMAWYTDTDNNNKYEFYIGQNGGVKANPDSSYLFAVFNHRELENDAYSANLTTIDLANLDTSNVTNMSNMFNFMQNVSSLDLSNFDTSNVTDMSNMFFYSYFHGNSSSIYKHSKLSSLDISSFDTSKVTNMSGMFYGLSLLTNLDIRHFDTSKVTDMSNMFTNLNSLTTLDVSNFDTSNVTNMSGMFANYLNNYNYQYFSSLASLDLSSFDTSKVTNMSSMFRNLTNLETIYVSNTWNTDLVNDSSQMFYMYKTSAKLKGSAGTMWSSVKDDKTYARVDGGTSSPGYFTYKASN